MPFRFLVLYLGLTAPLLANPFLGSWAFSLPDGNPAWLRVEHSAEGDRAALLWSVGSARPVQDLLVTGETIEFSRKLRWKPFGEEPGMQVTSPFTGKMEGERLILSFAQRPVDSPDADDEMVHLRGTRMPPLPPRPDLSKVQFGEPVDLLEEGLAGWRLSNPKKKNGWRLEDGVLINETPKTDFGAYGSYGNLRSKREFEDFQLTIDYNVGVGGNSGIYLRGMYEAQVVNRDSPMQGIQGPGAIFGRLAPSRNAGKPGVEWNRYRLTLVDRHITVELNGEVVIDNQPLEGCTGGGISADDTRPGPILLQGDHTSVRYRNIILRPRKP